MYKVKVFVTLKNSVLDPQGSAVMNALHSMNYQDVQDVRIGKFMELSIEASERNIDELINEMCQRLLSNPVIEDYRYEIEESVPK
ncbi:phosphoribosylformylglycinamidine synthase subunit PurS [Heyndrickxia acidicola]|uniref:Phosphoribosylformylglycinamidine synthase subunit PurS n=1 Tax=Heyndrickxia acidicola TaxID=209389 RepID=A0ABU6MED7_9BACI|nr:phosphoribosylformylglycinamidine synthase subunit PurS [Heyndrickxia acidicola]MED1202664.1 phosphoribosylformylglycinamidine synthase subunit PurS [Heyndrickxia acidicola]